MTPVLDAGSAGEPTLALLADPQTSGGLLAGFRTVDAAAALRACSAAGLSAAVVGEVRAGAGEITIAGEIHAQ